MSRGGRIGTEMPWCRNSFFITGGAGFIGRHLARALLERGYRVRVLDSLIEQVHAAAGGVPSELEPDVELSRRRCARRRRRWRARWSGVDKVVHLAAEVGVGQSMYAVDRYVSVNDYGTAVLFQQLIERPVRRVVVASSMSIYGEGLYRDAPTGSWSRMRSRQPRTGDEPWDPLDGRAGRYRRCRRRRASARASPRSTPSTKYVQERLTLTLAPAYGMEGVALRLWNVYGPGQALSNPYTGVLAIFASRLHNGQPPMVFEDGAAAPRLRACRGRRARLPAGAGAARGAPARCSTSAAARTARSSEVAELLAARHGPAGIWRRRSPARRAPATSATASPDIGQAQRDAWLRAAAAISPTAWRELAGLGGAAAGGGPGARGAPRTRGSGGWSHDAARRTRHGPVLVTGGAGFIGCNLADRLARDGHAVLVYDALARPGVEANLDWLQAAPSAGGSMPIIADIRDTAALRPMRSPRPTRCSIWPRRSR